MNMMPTKAASQREVAAPSSRWQRRRARTHEAERPSILQSDSSLDADADAFAKLVRPRAAAHLRSFRRDVERSLGSQVTDVLLFGSRARGDARRGSDYDVAVIIDGLEDRKRVNHQLADLAYPHVLAGCHIRAVSVPLDDLASPRSGLLAERIQHDGVPVA